MGKGGGRKRTRLAAEQAGIVATTRVGLQGNAGLRVPSSTSSGPSTKRGGRQQAAAVSEEALLVVAQQSGLSWTEATELQCTSRALCEACRQCIPVRVRVGANTPRGVWARSEVKGCGGITGGGRSERNGGTESGGGGSETKGGWDGDDWKSIATNGKAKKSKRQRRRQDQQQQQQQQQHQHNQQQQTGGAASTVSTRLVPRLKISSLVWEAPAVNLGDGSGLPAELTELTFCRDFNRPLSGLLWPPKLARLTFGSRFNRELSAKVQCRPRLPLSGSRVPPSGAVDVCGGDSGGSSGSIAHRRHDSDGRYRKSRENSRPSDTLGADSDGSDGTAVDHRSRNHHGTEHHHHRSEHCHGGIDHQGKKRAHDRESELSLLPGSLKELTLGKQFNKPLPRNVLPPGLVSLTLGRNFRHQGSVRDAVWPAGLKVIRFGEAMLKRQLRDGPRLEAMRGLLVSSLPSSSDDSQAKKKDFAWPAGLERVEFWQEGRAVVSLKGGKDLDPESVKWLCRN